MKHLSEIGLILALIGVIVLVLVQMGQLNQLEAQIEDIQGDLRGRIYTLEREVAEYQAELRVELDDVHTQIQFGLWPAVERIEDWIGIRRYWEVE